MTPTTRRSARGSLTRVASPDAIARSYVASGEPLLERAGSAPPPRARGRGLGWRSLRRRGGPRRSASTSAGQRTRYDRRKSAVTSSAAQSARLVRLPTAYRLALDDALARRRDAVGAVRGRPGWRRGARALGTRPRRPNATALDSRVGDSPEIRSDAARSRAAARPDRAARRRPRRARARGGARESRGLHGAAPFAAIAPAARGAHRNRALASKEWQMRLSKIDFTRARTMRRPSHARCPGRRIGIQRRAPRAEPAAIRRRDRGVSELRRSLPHFAPRRRFSLLGGVRARAQRRPRGGRTHSRDGSLAVSDAATSAEARALRVQVCSELARRGDGDCAEQTSPSAVRDPSQIDDGHTKRAAMNALINMRADRAVPIATQLLANRNQPPEVRQAGALHSRGQGGGSRSRGAGARNARSEWPLDAAEHLESSATQAIFWLSEIRGDESLDALARLLDAGDPRRRPQELRAFFAVSQHESPRAMGLLREFTQNDAARRRASQTARSSGSAEEGEEQAAAVLMDLYGKRRRIRRSNADALRRRRNRGGQSRSIGCSRARTIRAEPLETRKKALFYASKPGVPVEGLRSVYRRRTEPDFAST